MFFVFYSYSGIFCMKCLMLSTAVEMVFIWIGWHWRPLLEWFLYELVDTGDCWGNFADYLFFTQLFYMFMWGGWGNFSNLEFFNQWNCQILDYHWGNFSNSEKFPQPACYIHIFIGEKQSKKKKFPNILNTHPLHHTQIHEIRHIT